jgi:hypothetical protein
VNRRLDPTVECDLLLAFMRVEDVLPQCYLSRVNFWTVVQRFDSGFYGIPLAPAVGGAAANIEVLLNPEAEAVCFRQGCMT